MGPKADKIKSRFDRIRKSGKTKNFLVFLVFVCIAFIFWLFLALSDSVQRNIELPVVIANKPDSVTFLSDPPKMINVSVRDKGSRLLNHLIFRDKQLVLDFDTYASESHFRLPHSALLSSLKEVFGNDAVISAVNPDSISIAFTSGKGRKLAVVPLYNVSCAAGMAINGEPKVYPDSVVVYGLDDVDPLTAVYTEKIVLRDVDKVTEKKAKIKKIPHTRIVPQEVNLSFNVEQLVKKVSEVPVMASYIPAGEDILFFPAKVKVTYYVPVSKYNEPDTGIEVMASFNEAVKSSTDKVSVKITKHAPYMTRVELATDSIQYTLVRED